MIWKCFVCERWQPCKHREPELLAWARNGQKVIRQGPYPSDAAERRARYLAEVGRVESKRVAA